MEKQKKEMHPVSLIGLTLASVAIVCGTVGYLGGKVTGVSDGYDDGINACTEKVIGFPARADQLPKGKTVRVEYCLPLVGLHQVSQCLVDRGVEDGLRFYEFIWEKQIKSGDLVAYADGELHVNGKSALAAWQ